MSISRGPLRIVLLRSGGYDYAELDLQTPIHLVAGNNVGKTTLIAALQFLYIDDARQMHFAHDSKKTKQHYFPDSGSFVLFECMTPTGLQVFGLRGQGPVQGFEYDRFAYSGAYDRDDYLDGRTPRPWDEVRRRLLSRDLRPMEPRHLKASLTGSGDAKGHPLGLVPLKRSGSYDSFRFLFRNLLRLSRIEQKQLKELFIDICRPRLRQVEVDIKRDYAEMFARVEKDAGDVEALQVVAPDIEDLVVRFEERRALRGRLVANWSKIERVLHDEQERVREATKQLDDRRAQVTTALEELVRRQSANRDESQRLGKQQGALETQRSTLQDLRDKAHSFVPEMEEALREQLRAELDELVARLSGATRADRKQVERELRTLRSQIKKDKDLVLRHADAVVTWLRANAGLDDDSLADVFTVANPALLGEVVGDGVDIEDASSVVRLVGAIAAAFDEAGFRSHGLRLHRPPSGLGSPLANYQDVETVRERLGQNERRAADLDQVVADLDALEAVEKERKSVEDQLEAAKERKRIWDSWQKQQPELEEVGRQLEALATQAAELEQQSTDLQRDHTKLALEQSGFDRQIQDLRDELRRRAGDVQRLNRPQLSWSETAGPDDEQACSLDELIRTYRQDDSRHRTLDAKVDQLFANVEHKTAGRHQGTDETDTILRLQDELEALADRQRVVQELWSSLVDGMRSAFKSLVEAVDEVKREVSRLTTALGRRQVSNLERVELVLVEQRDILGRLKAVIDAEETPLFAGPGGRTRAARDVQSWLETRSRIDLADLFDLRFRIIDVRGQQKTFESLSQIESQGTSTTIKVLVHLELLRTMLTDETVAVPFFLDEVATLDPANLGALIEHATTMGFVPVVASPHASDCVDTLYFLRRSEGGLVLDDTSRVQLHRNRTDAS